MSRAFVGAAMAAIGRAAKAIAAVAAPTFVVLSCFAGMAHAQERILSYDSRIEVQADGSLEVTEDIRVRAEGRSIRRGIYRDFPTRYEDRFGNNVVVGFEVLEVRRDGRAEPWFTERRGNGVRVNTGNDDFLPVPADYTYRLRYRTTRQLGFFSDHDELYFNAVGTGWEFPIERARAEVRLPAPVPVARMRAEGYTGGYGSTAREFTAALPAPGVARWTAGRPLAPGEGMTVVLSFPKGIVAAPTTAQRIGWLLKDNSAALIALAGLAVLLAYCIARWRAVGRDPRAGVVVVRYEPPQDLSPAALRFVRRMGYDNRCFSADVLACAVGGWLRIHRDDRLLKDAWRLERTGGAATDALPAQHALLARLFAAGDELELDQAQASTLREAIAAHTAALEKRFHPAMFKRNGGSIAIAALIMGATLALAFGIGVGLLGSGPVLALPVAGAMLVVVIAFALLVKAPTPEGRKLMDAIEGFRRYLGVAERDELAAVPGPDAPPALDAGRYERLLPYAVALEVEDAWTRRFTEAVGAAVAAQATQAISWYRGAQLNDLGGLTRAVGAGLASQIASSSTPPGSSSGAGGGGFSGGGGGGGGGGGR